MFQFEKTILRENRSCRYQLSHNNQQISFNQFLSLLWDDQQFRSFFISVLKEVPFRAYHWETPPISTSNIDRPFEFVVTNSPGIDLKANAGPFRQYFRELEENEQIAVFDNLGKDALLIAPDAPDSSLNYSHIGTFTKLAPQEQQHALWKRVGKVTRKQISNKPLWLNTAGGGVAWLHVRLDSRPKYYKHHPYR